MEKSVFILRGSPRKNGNSNQLTDAFVAGLKETDLRIEDFHIQEKNISGCIQCDQCFKEKPCIFDDDFNVFAQALLEHDILVISCGVYWGTFPAQVKMFIDKLYSFAISETKTKVRRAMLILAAEYDEPNTFDMINNSFRDLADFFEWEVLDPILLPGVYGPDDIKNTDAPALAKARGKEFH